MLSSTGPHSISIGRLVYIPDCGGKQHSLTHSPQSISPHCVPINTVCESLGYMCSVAMTGFSPDAKLTCIRQSSTSHVEKVVIHRLHLYECSLVLADSPGLRWIMTFVSGSGISSAFYQYPETARQKWSSNMPMRRIEPGPSAWVWVSIVSRRLLQYHGGRHQTF